jgi:hypothetical protein
MTGISASLRIAPCIPIIPNSIANPNPPKIVSQKCISPKILLMCFFVNLEILHRVYQRLLKEDPIEERDECEKASPSYYANI